MARFARYLREEKYIAALDTGSIRRRVEYGWRQLADRKVTHPNGRVRHGVDEALVLNATLSGYKLSVSELRYRRQAGKTYDTEAKLANMLASFDTWRDLIQARFPAVDVPDDDGEMPDRRDADEKRRDAANTRKQLTAAMENYPTLFDWDPPHQFRGDEHGPRSAIKELYAVCDESERYTAGMAANDTKRRAYVDECAAAVGGDLDKTWYEAEQRRRGLAATGLTDWDDLTEIMEEFFQFHDDAENNDEGDDDEGDDLD
jgi:hypothetical protein